MLKRMQTNQYEEIEKYFEKGILCVILSLLPTKKNAKMDAKHSILRNKKTLRETCIMSVYFSQEPQGKKRKNSCIWRSFVDTKILKLMNNILN